MVIQFIMLLNTREIFLIKLMPFMADKLCTFCGGVTHYMLLLIKAGLSIDKVVDISATGSYDR
jgi:hypothetical protein